MLGQTDRRRQIDRWTGRIRTNATSRRRHDGARRVLEETIRTRPRWTRLGRGRRTRTVEEPTMPYTANQGVRIRYRVDGDGPTSVFSSPLPEHDERLALKSPLALVVGLLGEPKSSAR